MMVDPLSEAYAAWSEPFSFSAENVSRTNRMIYRLFAYRWINGRIVHPLPHAQSQALARILAHGYATVAMLSFNENLIKYGTRDANKTCNKTNT